MIPKEKLETVSQPIETQLAQPVENQLRSTKTIEKTRLPPLLHPSYLPNAPPTPNLTYTHHGMPIEDQYLHLYQFPPQYQAQYPPPPSTSNHIGQTDKKTDMLETLDRMVGRVPTRLQTDNLSVFKAFRNQPRLNRYARLVTAFILTNWYWIRIFVIILCLALGFMILAPVIAL